MNYKMTSQNSFLLTNSQEEMVVSAVNDVLPQIGDDIHELLNPGDFEIMETKYDISSAELMLPQQPPLSLPVPPQPQITNEEFPGPYNFQLTPDSQEDTKSWVYSQKLKKVFIEMDKTLPMRVNWSPLERDLRVRAIMAFCQPTHRSEPVRRCHNHVALSDRSIPYPYHVLRCKHAQAVYEENNGHLSVLVPLGTPQPGSGAVQMDFVFHCKNSCSTGINRRPTEVVFSLENAIGQVLGRRKLQVRICSCPKRDREKDERSLREQSAPKKRKIAPGKKLAAPVYREHQLVESDPAEIYTFSARIYGRENYEFLKRIACGLMAESMESTGQQAVIKPLIDDIKRMP